MTKKQIPTETMPLGVEAEKGHLLLVGQTGSGKTKLAKEVVSSRIKGNPDTQVFWCSDFDECIENATRVTPNDLVATLELMRLGEAPCLVVIDGADAMSLSPSCWETIEVSLARKPISCIITAQCIQRVSSVLPLHLFHTRCLLGRTGTDTNMINRFFRQTDNLFFQAYAELLARRVWDEIEKGKRVAIVNGEIRLIPDLAH
jgi:energy-coupling factor transporter ATP-binding protein EcfA2